jgi:hypothetical protein
MDKAQQRAARELAGATSSGVLPVLRVEIVIANRKKPGTRDASRVCESRRLSIRSPATRHCVLLYTDH